MEKEININIPSGGEKIIEMLQKAGFEAYVVGGCVRDSILGKEPEDWDITTNALPEETLKIFEEEYKVIPTGLKHGTLTLLDWDGTPYEVTTFRIDGEYTDGRHPDEVVFTSDLREDLSRRDFTINAMAYSHRTGLVDYFKGIDDIGKKVIRCVGDGDKRFNEDALRMLRGVRFSAQLGFDIEEGTKKAIIQNAALIQNVSIERIQQEFNKIIIRNPMRIDDLWQLGLLKYFLPEYGLCVGAPQNNPYHIYSIDRHILESMCNIEAGIDLRLTMLLHDIGKPEVKTTDEKGIDHFYNHEELSASKAEEILRRMRYDNRTIEKVSKLIKYHDAEISGKKSLRRMLFKLGEEDLRDLIKVKEADILAHNMKYYHKGHSKLERIKTELEEIINEGNCFTLRDLKINGNDLINIGLKPGKGMGDILNWLLDMVIDNPELNQRDTLLDLVKGRETSLK